MGKVIKEAGIPYPQRPREFGAGTARRRALNAEGLARLTATLQDHGLEPVEGAGGNFLYVEVGEDAGPLFEQLLQRFSDFCLPLLRNVLDQCLHRAFDQ